MRCAGEAIRTRQFTLNYPKFLFKIFRPFSVIFYLHPQTSFNNRFKMPRNYKQRLSESEIRRLIAIDVASVDCAREQDPYQKGPKKKIPIPGEDQRPISQPQHFPKNHTKMYVHHTRIHTVYVSIRAIIVRRFRVEFEITFLFTIDQWNRHNVFWLVINRRSRAVAF